MGNNLRIVFPKGAGGSWLSSLIWDLIIGNESIPNVDTNFDNEPRGSIMRDHYPLDPTYKKIPKVLFSTRRFFNVYLNHAKKILYPIHHVNQLSDGAKIVLLADKIQPWLNNTDFKNFYCTDIDLEYELIFFDQLQFIKRLYEVLDQNNISYIKNNRYIKSSVLNYRNTCESPNKHLGNTDSAEWLGFCLALSRVKNIAVPPFDFNDSIENIKPNFYHLQLTALKFVKPYMFKWK